MGAINLGVTSIYLQGIDSAEIIATVHARKAPMTPPAADSASKPAPPAVAPELLALSRPGIAPTHRVAKPRRPLDSAELRL
jgi:hypothetical protein